MKRLLFVIWVLCAVYLWQIPYTPTQYAQALLCAALFLYFAGLVAVWVWEGFKKACEERREQS